MNKRALTTIDSLVELLAQDLSSYNAIQEVEAQASGGNMLSMMESVTAKFKTVIDAEKRAFRTARMTVGRAAHDTARVLRIVIFLHSAKDFPSVLRLYGIEESSVAE